jgi:outer membrane lipoprotein-sorting protein
MRIPFLALTLGVLLLARAEAQSPGDGAELPEAEALLTRVDTNLTFESRTVTATMTVTRRGRTKVYTLLSMGRGVDEAATEFLAPARDAGTRMLKRGNELWIYMPAIERVQKISGHMLRQGMMGSDLSYEDMMEFSDWRQAYTATVQGEVPCGSSTCWSLELLARDDTIAYPRRVVSVDQQTGLPVMQELYALSGMLLKTWTMEDAVAHGERWYPQRMVIDDRLQEGTQTVLEFTDLDFSTPVGDATFSRRWLER